MSLHPMELRLAVLEAILRRNVSYRPAARIYGVSRATIESWIKKHRSGECTIEMLYAQGVQPAPPGRSPATTVVLAEASAWQQRGAELLQKLTEERELLVGQREGIEQRIKKLDEMIGSLLAFPRPVPVETDEDSVG